jgi:hypothetical protein
MAKSASPVVQQFPITTLTAVLAEGAREVGRVEDSLGAVLESVSERINQLFTGWTDSMIVAQSIPKDNAGRNLIRKSFNDAWRESIASEEGQAVAFALAGDVFRGKVSEKTLSQYVTGATLAYFAGVAWTPRAANTVEQGGIERPEWWKALEAKRSESVKAARAAKAGKGDAGKAPGKVETVDAPGVNKALTAALLMIRALHGDKVADDATDALTDTVPGFRITV